MVAAGGAVEQGVDGGGIGDIADEQFAARVEVFAPAGREVIEAADPMAMCQQSIDEMRPDEARGSGNGEHCQGTPRPGDARPVR